jgi:hypothetical protein
LPNKQQNVQCLLGNTLGTGSSVDNHANSVFILLTSFIVRLATDLTSGHTKMIEYFAAIFVELQQSLDRGLRKHTAFVATRTESMTHQILRAIQDSGMYISPMLYPTSPRN